MLKHEKKLLKRANTIRTSIPAMKKNLLLINTVRR